MARSNPEPWVWEEWNELVSINQNRPPFAEVLRRTRALFDRTYRNGVWTVGFDGAELTATLASNVEIEALEFEAAARCLRALLTHPNYDQCDRVIRPEIEGDIAAFEIWEGNLEEGIARLRQVMSGKTRTQSLLTVCYRLWSVLEGPLTTPGPIPSPLADFVREFAGEYEGTKKAVAACDDSREGLLDLLDDAFGRRPKKVRASS